VHTTTVQYLNHDFPEGNRFHDGLRHDPVIQIYPCIVQTATTFQPKSLDLSDRKRQAKRSNKRIWPQLQDGRTQSSPFHQPRHIGMRLAPPRPETFVSKESLWQDFSRTMLTTYRWSQFQRRSNLHSHRICLLHLPRHKVMICCHLQRPRDRILTG